MTLRHDPAIAGANAAHPASAHVRAMANDLHVRLSDVTPTGAGNRISIEDVRAAAGRTRTGTGGGTDGRDAVDHGRRALAAADARDGAWFDGPAPEPEPAPSGNTVLVDREGLRQLVEQAEAADRDDDDPDAWFPGYTVPGQNGAA